MKFQTMTTAIDPEDGKLKEWIGPRIEAISWQDAENKIAEYGYLRITGILHSEIDEHTNEKQEFLFWN